MASVSVTLHDKFGTAIDETGIYWQLWTTDPALGGAAHSQGGPVDSASSILTINFIEGSPPAEAWLVLYEPTEHKIGYYKLPVSA